MSGRTLRAVEWLVCSTCPPGDNEWTADCFTAAGNAYEVTRMCNACYLERYPRRKVPCAGCGRIVETRGKGEEVRCRPCRRNRKATHCKCGTAFAGREVVRGVCRNCYQRDRRASRQERAA